MCGIVGQFNLHEAGQKKLRQATDRLLHRGPDDSGIFTDRHVSFGFRRLAILDLSPAGHQPMSSRDGKITVVHNGEIYNYLELRTMLQQQFSMTFRSDSDTEVIIAAYQAWGTKCFEKFNGMWAIALWDARSDQLILSRDRFGEKPLYYTSHRGGYIFGSEIKALLEMLPQSPQPNPRMITDYLVFGFHDHSKETFFQGIFQLEPAQYAIVSKNGFHIHRYWALSSRKSASVNFSEAAEEFRHLFTDSVRLRLRSDVPIGTCLSGGLDSSSIALTVFHALRHENSQITQKTFTSCSELPQYDESRYSREINTIIHAEQNEVYPTAQGFKQDFAQLLWHQEEPFLSLSIYAQWELMKRAKSRGITVLLDGQGGDEILAGYLPFFASLLADKLRKGNVADFIRQFRGFMQLHRSSLPDILPTFLLYLLPKNIGRFAFRYGGRREVTLLSRSLRNEYLHYPDLPRPFSSQLKNHLFRLLTGEGVRALLHYEDRNAMAFSIESRVPFLDHRLAEFTLSLPDHFLLDQGQTKRLLRQALRSILPESIRERHEKMGFVIPQKEWMRGELGQDFRALDARALSVHQYVDPSALRTLVNKFFSGDDGLTALLWRVYNLEQWMRKFFA